MDALVGLPAGRRQPLATGEKWLLAILCLCAGIVPLAARWISEDAATRLASGLLVAVVYLVFTLFARREPSLRPFWELSFAFFIFALVQVLNNSIPGYIGTDILHAPPNAGDPLASTVSATVVVQLLEALVAIVPVVGFTRLVGRDLGSIYARPGKRGGWLVFAVVFFVAVYLFIATLPLRPDSPVHRLFPMNGALTLDRLLALTPALLVMAISNGFEEEFLFRGLFLQKYHAFFGIAMSNVLQAVIFSVAHAGVTYTPSALLFIVAVVFPLGLAAGYLMRATNGVLTPAIFHAGLDLAIYLTFLTYVT
jgi:membrane protease YdiL (CAAX protease family)